MTPVVRKDQRKARPLCYRPRLEALEARLGAQPRILVRPHDFDAADAVKPPPPVRPGPEESGLHSGGAGSALARRGAGAAM